MRKSKSEYKLAENEVIARQRNKRATDRLVTTKSIASEEGQQDFVKNLDDIVLQFYCECSDESCRRRIKLTPKEYAEQHKNTSQFILLPGHNVPKIERIVFDGGKYLVVEKFIAIPLTVKSH